jgi:lipopolysaccharide export LptBFGC system permease protein LptF
MDIPTLIQEADRHQERIADRLQQIEGRVHNAGFDSYRDFTRQFRYDPDPPRWRRLLKRVKEPAEPEDPSQAQLLMAVRKDQSEVDRMVRKRDEFWVEVHKKFSIPFACVVFIFLGGSLGLRTAKGGFANMPWP